VHASSSVVVVVVVVVVIVVVVVVVLRGDERSDEFWSVGRVHVSELLIVCIQCFRLLFGVHQISTCVST
jgi:hypothetical protein